MTVVTLTNALPHRSHNGQLGNRDGFTLIELVVVLMILGLMVMIVVPNFPGPKTISGQQRLVDWIDRQNQRLRYLAARNQQVFALNINLLDKRLWVTHAGMKPEERNVAISQGIELPTSVHINEVIFPIDSQKSDQSHIAIRYFPRGYSDMAVIHISSEDNQRQRLRIEPFLSELFTVPEDGA